MSHRGRERGRRLLEVGLALLCATGAGCGGGEDGPAPAATNRVVGRPVELRRTMRPLSLAPDTNPAPDTGLAHAEEVTVDARVLVITADGTDPSADAIIETLRYLGTPFDVLNASTGPALTAADLAVADHGRYYAVVLDVGDLAAGNQSAFTDQEWMTLASYEARFGVRRAVMYAYPTDAYGLTSTGGFDVSTRPIAARCTPAGAGVFVGVNCAVPLLIDDGWAYSSQATDAATVPLLVDDAGTVYAATRTYPDGREALVLTFAQSPFELHTLQLAYGVVSWVTRGLFVGERHVYLSPQIDDFFLASQLYPMAGTYRITADDLQAFASWQSGRNADPLTAQLRAAFAFNAFGAKAPGRDGLTDTALALGPAFEWINHTWDHAEMDAMGYAKAFEELAQNDQYAVGAGLSRYTVANLVTPSMTGLGNAEAMRAAYDVGVRQVISDGSSACQASPSPNTGYYNALVPGLLQVPRYPTNLYFNVSQPAEWVAEYQMLRAAPSATLEQIVETESTQQLRFLLRGASNPWMFHQANLRDLGGGQSLITLFLDAVLSKYAARATFPVVSATMDDLARRLKARMAFDAAGVSASIEPGGKLTVRVAKAGTIPVTGLCTPGAEAYAGQQISYLRLGDGESITLSLGDCNPGFVPGAAGGADGGVGDDGVAPDGPTAGGNCPATGGGGASGAGGAVGGGTGGAGGDTTMGHLSTDAAADPAYGGGGSGCNCRVSRSTPGPGAGVALIAIGLALARRRRSAQAS